MKKCLCLTVLLLSSPALAGERLEEDRRFAEHHLNSAMRTQCVEDFARRASRTKNVSASGDARFSTALTDMVYRDIYWKNADRGVVFLLPVKAHDPALGEVSADIACLYAVGDEGLEFQLSQQVLRRL